MASWLAVASADHVARGVAGGFMQVCHGKMAPLRRILAQDHVIYYSPTLYFGKKQPLQAFTAYGLVLDAPPYQADMGNGFRPFRRDVSWQKAGDVPVRDLKHLLKFTSAANWGYALRFGLLPLDEADRNIIAAAMLLQAG